MHKLIGVVVFVIGSCIYTQAQELPQERKETILAIQEILDRNGPPPRTLLGYFETRIEFITALGLVDRPALAAKMGYPDEYARSLLIGGLVLAGEFQTAADLMPDDTQQLHEHLFFPISMLAHYGDFDKIDAFCKRLRLERSDCMVAHALYFNAFEAGRQIPDWLAVHVSEGHESLKLNAKRAADRRRLKLRIARAFGEHWAMCIPTPDIDAQTGERQQPNDDVLLDNLILDVVRAQEEGNIAALKAAVSELRSALTRIKGDRDGWEALHSWVVIRLTGCEERAALEAMLNGLSNLRTRVAIALDCDRDLALTLLEEASDDTYSNAVMVLGEWMRVSLDDHEVVEFSKKIKDPYRRVILLAVSLFD